MAKVRNFAYLSPIFRAASIICGCAPGLNRFEAVELVDGDARTRRRPFERNDILPGGDQAAARRLDRGLDNRDILFLISKSVMSVSVTT